MSIMPMIVNRNERNAGLKIPSFFQTANLSLSLSLHISFSLSPHISILCLNVSFCFPSRVPPSISDFAIFTASLSFVDLNVCEPISSASDQGRRCHRRRSQRSSRRKLFFEIPCLKNFLSRVELEKRRDGDHDIQTVLDFQLLLLLLLSVVMLLLLLSVVMVAIMVE